MLEGLKYEFIRTPLEEPLKKLRYAIQFWRRRKHPELREIYLEEKRISLILRDIVRPDSNCIDIGGHYGSILSRICALAPRGKHRVFEAIPEKAVFLRRKFPEVEVHNIALSDRTGTASFYVNLDKSGFSSLAKQDGGKWRELSVPCGRLDDYVSPEVPIHFIKADVEGAEFSVFQGARELIARDRPVILFEYAPESAEAFGREPRDIYDLFCEDFGYSIYSLKDWLSRKGPVSAGDFQDAAVYPFKAFNWIAAPAESSPPVTERP